MITSAGRRVELRRVGTSNVYEAGDSSYLQMIESGNGLLLRTTDGTQMSYSRTGTDFHCTGIEDRNGNIITPTYSGDDLATVTDTLGRGLTVNYDGNGNIQSITQTWTVNGVQQTHIWATFGWVDPVTGAGPVTLHPAFSGYTVVGAYDGETIPVLRWVGLADGSHYNFEYTDRGQVNVIRHYAAAGGSGMADDFQLSYLAYNYESPTNDCPRISAARVWASNWSGVNGVPSEVVTYLSDNHDGTHHITAPDGTVFKEFYGSGWQHGLVTSSQVITGSTVQKTTTTAYDQDNTSVPYQTNPRVIETNVSDGTNNRRTTIDYSNSSYRLYGLPYYVSEYAANGTEMRRTYTDYNLSQSYLDHRIIGLVSAVHLVDVTSGWNVKSKISYAYDLSAINAQATDAPGHDQSHDNTWTVRGNVTAVSRWDTTDASSTNDVSKTHTTTLGYDAAGSLLYTSDPSGHYSSLHYGDWFSDGVNRNTFAYVTTATDADGNNASVQYNYDFGAKTRTQGPPPQNQSQGIIQTFSYDEATRLKQVTTTNTGAYVHYDYGPDYTSTFASVNSVAPNYWQSDSYTNQFFDGMGRVFAVSSNHPGSSGGNKAQYTRYDQMGRVVQQTNPFEIDSGWNPTGDDAAGYQFNVANTFDWKGRPLRSYNMDGTYKEASYVGCGCAGGEVVTLTDEVGREQKVYSDVLGRQVKSEILQTVNSVTSIYSSVVNTYNVRDQVALVRQWAGAENGGGAYQDTTMSYDGYGRLQTKHVPEQRDQSDNPTYTTYSYNPDNTINSVTDARGASASYVYNNNRGLVNGINYYAPSGVASTANVSFTYDAVGNRTSMTDGLGSATYSFDSLSRITSETRNFSGVGSYTLGYDYNYANELTRITDPTNASIYYGHDNAGRVNSVTGSPYGTGGYGGIPYVEVSQYASNFQYRAFGGLKSLSYGNNPLTLAIGYDSRLRPSDFEVGNRPAQFGSPTAMKTQNQFYANDDPRYSHDLLDERFDRAFSYDNIGAAKEAYSGSEARDFVNNTNSGTATGPYRQSYQHDAFGNMTSRTNRFWSHVDNFSANYANNRRQDTGYIYDADGRLMHDPDVQYTYDAVGENASIFSAANNQTITVTYDGAEQVGKRVNNQNGAADVTYYVWSSVTGKVITELYENGTKRKGNIYLGDQLLATQASAWVVWQHDDPIAGTRGVSSRDGGYSIDTSPDPMGIDLGQSDPFVQLGTIDPPPENTPGLLGGSGIPNGRCTLDGISIDCGWAMELMAMEAAVPAPPTTVWANGRWNFVNFNPNTGGYGFWQNANTASGVLDPDTHLPIPGGGFGSGADQGRRWVSLSSGTFFAPPRRGNEPRHYWLQTPPHTPIDPNILTRTETLMSKPTCKEFLNSLLAELGRIAGRGREGVTFEQLFNAARGFIHASPNLNARGQAGQQLIGNPGVDIDILIRPTVPSDEQSAPTSIMHEVIHDAPGSGEQYSHTYMARAAFAVADAMGMTKDHDYPLQLGQQPKRFEGTYDQKTAADNWNSSLFEQILVHACR